MSVKPIRQIHDSQTLGLRPCLQDRVQSMRAIWTFVAVALGWSWGLGFAAVQAKAYSGSLNTALLIASGFGPSFAGFAVVALFSTRGGLHAWLVRSLHWRIGWRWYALVFLAPPALMIAVRAVSAANGGPISALPTVGEVLLVIASFGTGLLVGGPLSEEFGWRGYAMPALTARLNWFVASLIVGVAWGLWHLPLFFMAGTVQSHMQIAPFMLSIITSSVLFGWLFEHTQRSVLPAIFLHMSVNAWTGILVVPLTVTVRPAALATTLLVGVVAVLIVRFVTGRERDSGIVATIKPC